MSDDVLKWEAVIHGKANKLKFFSRPHPLGGVTYAFDWVLDGQSQGLLEARDKTAVLADFHKLKDTLINET